MMQRSKGFFDAFKVAALAGAFVLAGCAPKADLPGEAAADTGTQATAPEVVGEPETVTEVSTAQPVPQDGGPLEVREIKVISDNGQEGVFTKLTRPPRSVAHFTLTDPNRVVIEVEGDTAASPQADQFAVDNPLLKQIRVGSHAGKMRITVVLKGDVFPSYTVNDLNDTLVAFIGEPRGKDLPVREQLVYSASAKPVVGAVPAPQPGGPAAPVSREPAAPRASVPAVEMAPERAALTLPEGEEEDADAGLVFGEKKNYYGQPISLDLKDADVRNVLRLIAEVSQLNVVATDDVKGQITLRLFEVPWDQAFDIILTVMGLEKVQQGNVVRVSTIKRLKDERKQRREAKLEEQRGMPLLVDYIRVNYAKAENLHKLIAQRGAGRGARGAGDRGAGDRGGLLSQRGSVLVDSFTNTLIVRDTAEHIKNVRDFVRRLDIQIPQVLIESNIVEASTDFARDLGIQWGYSASIGPQTGTSTGANFPGSIGLGGSGLGSGATGLPFLIDFPAGNVTTGSGSALNLALGSLNGAQQLDMRLTALETAGKARIISRPRVVTLNNVAAQIKSVTIIRVRKLQDETSINTGAGGTAGGGAGTTATEEIETGIVLKVTPQVSADGYVLLNIDAKSSQADFSRTVDNIPTEIERSANSNVLVRDGQTVVLGGIYRDTLNATESGVPFLNGIPGLSWLFRSESKSNRREDLLVFLTPRIIKGAKGQELPSAQELWQERGGNSPG